MTVCSPFSLVFPPPPPAARRLPPAAAGCHLLPRAGRLPGWLLPLAHLTVLAVVLARWAGYAKQLVSSFHAALFYSHTATKSKPRQVKSKGKCTAKHTRTYEEVEDHDEEGAASLMMVAACQQLPPSSTAPLYASSLIHLEV